MNSLNLPTKAKFSFLALRNACLGDDLTFPLELGNGLWILNEFPLEVSEFWKQRLGEYQIDNVKKSNFILFLFKESNSLNIRDEESQDLDLIRDYCFDILTLNLIPSFNKIFKFCGYYDNDHLMIWNISSVFPPPYFQIEAPISKSHLSALPPSANMLKQIMFTSEEDYWRFKRGYISLMQGVSERFEDQRIHKFVRAIEAFLNCREGQSKRDFAHRGGLLIGVDEDKKKILKEIYSLRSCAEHMNKYDLVLQEYSEEDRKKINYQRVYQAERLACELYLRLLNQPALHEILKDNVEVENFWNKPDDEIVKIWGKPIQLPEAII